MGRSLLRELRQNRLAAASVVFLVAVVALALLAPYIAPYSPQQQHDVPAEIADERALDGDGRRRAGYLYRQLYGARISLFIAVIGTLGAVVLGTLLGLIAGFSGGWIDEAIMRVIDVTFAFPGVLFAILIVSVLGPGLSNW